MFWGPRPLLGCVLQNLGQSLTRVKIRVASTQKGPNIVSQKVHLGGSKLTTYFLVSGRNFTGFLSWNAGGQFSTHIDGVKIRCTHEYIVLLINIFQNTTFCDNLVVKKSYTKTSHQPPLTIVFPTYSVPTIGTTFKSSALTTVLDNVRNKTMCNVFIRTGQTMHYLSANHQRVQHTANFWVSPRWILVDF